MQIPGALTAAQRGSSRAAAVRCARDGTGSEGKVVAQDIEPAVVGCVTEAGEPGRINWGDRGNGTFLDGRSRGSRHQPGHCGHAAVARRGARDLPRLRRQPRRRSVLPEFRRRVALPAWRIRRPARLPAVGLRRWRPGRLRRDAAAARCGLRQRLRNEAVVCSPRFSALRPGPPDGAGPARRSPTQRLFGDAVGHAGRHGSGARPVRRARL